MRKRLYGASRSSVEPLKRLETDLMKYTKATPPHLEEREDLQPCMFCMTPTKFYDKRTLSRVCSPQCQEMLFEEQTEAFKKQEDYFREIGSP